MTDGDKQKYLDFLNEDIESDRFLASAQFQAITIMSNHTHEVVKVLIPEVFSNHMRRHHSRYGMYFNRQNNRCGKVAQDRPKTCLIADDYHEMKTIFYIHANPIRANIVRDARNYYWSTHRLYAFGKREPWMKHIRLPNWYVKLGNTPEQRQRAYRRMFARYLREEGRRTQTFHRKLYFGPLTWTMEREKEVSRWRAMHAPP